MDDVMVNLLLPMNSSRPGNSRLVVLCSAASDSATPWAVALQAPLSMGFLKKEHWSGLPFPSLVDLPNPGMEPVSPGLAGRCFITVPPGKPRREVQIHA